MSESDPIVRFVGVAKTYDGVTRIVDGLDLDIERRAGCGLAGRESDVLVQCRCQSTLSVARKCSHSACDVH